MNTRNIFSRALENEAQTKADWEDSRIAWREEERRGKTCHGTHGQDGQHQPDTGTLGEARQAARGEDPKRVDCREDQTGKDFLANDQSDARRAEARIQQGG